MFDNGREAVGKPQVQREIFGTDIKKLDSKRLALFE